MSRKVRGVFQPVFMGSDTVFFLKHILKKEGKIRHVGFSFRSTAEELEEILKAHPEAEFVQLQIWRKQ